MDKFIANVIIKNKRKDSAQTCTQNDVPKGKKLL